MTPTTHATGEPCAACQEARGYHEDMERQRGALMAGLIRRDDHEKHRYRVGQRVPREAEVNTHTAANPDYLAGAVE